MRAPALQSNEVKYLARISAPASPMWFPPLLRFAYLQLLDILTTLAFLVSGVQEGNPLVRSLISATGNPLLALLYLKLFGVALAIYCCRRGKLQLLGRINFLYSIVIAWNLVALVLGSANPR